MLKEIQDSCLFNIYLENVYNKNYPIFRYHRYVEQIITSIDELNQLLHKFAGYSVVLPKTINRPIVLMKNEMMNIKNSKYMFNHLAKLMTGSN